MIKTLYKPFRHWSEGGSVYIISDTHFDDQDCKLMNLDWITPEEQIARINSVVAKNDTLIHLGDVGSPEYMNRIKAHYKVLILGNHDRGKSTYEKYFDEVYDGALQIAQKIIISHEPLVINTLVDSKNSPVMNLHGHTHNGCFIESKFSRNFCADVIDYTPISLGAMIKKGLLSRVRDIHNITIHNI